MDGPLLYALIRARLAAGEGSVQSVWVSPRALALGWAPAGLGPGLAWIFLLNPSPELWLLHEKDRAYLHLKAEAKGDLTRRWGQELKGARLREVEGDPRERWAALVLQRRVITGRVEAMRLVFQGIPGRAGLRLDGLDLNPARMGLGHLLAQAPPIPQEDPPPFLRWKAAFGDRLDQALAGALPEVLPGEGSLLERHRAWSLDRAEKIVLAPRKAAVDRTLEREEKRLARFREALDQDRARHQGTLARRGPAQALAAELYRLRGASGRVELLDGTCLDLPEGMRAEESVQRWFSSVKRAERGVQRIAILEEDRQRQVAALEARKAAMSVESRPGPAAIRPGSAGPRKGAKPGKGRGMDRENPKETRRQDGKGKAFRSCVVEGFEVIIGKGDADNDHLTFKVADPLDLWLHVAGQPGSHVIVRNPERIADLPRPVIERAAELAAFHSKARDGGKVEVHWCRAADVSKPRGFPPGKVMLKQWKSLRVYPKG